MTGQASIAAEQEELRAAEGEGGRGRGGGGWRDVGGAGGASGARNAGRERWMGEEGMEGDTCHL
jgi:hypothetical protein